MLTIFIWMKVNSPITEYRSKSWNIVWVPNDVLRTLRQFNREPKLAAVKHNAD